MPNYRIAELLVKMDTWGRSLRQAEKYLVQDSGEPDIVITQPNPIQIENQPLSPDDMVYMFNGLDFYKKLLRFEGMMLHSSAVMMDGKAYLFSAPSGVGKSTHTRLWGRVFGTDRAQVINDDKPALRCRDGEWYAYGTPWSGKATTSLNVRVPVAGICFLKRGEKNTIRRLSPQEAVFHVLNQTVRTKDYHLRETLLSVVDRLVSQVKVYEMQCNMEPEAAFLSHGVMSGEIQL